MTAASTITAAPTITTAPTRTAAPTITTAPTMTPDYHATLAALPTLTLDELVATAAMQTRIDRKYLLPRAALAEVVAAVATEAAILDIDGQRAFGYRSVYLDTPDLDSYFAAGRGRRRRFKVRTRSYLDTGTTWLEIKTRGPRGTTVKERTAHPDAEAAGLTAVGQAFLAQCLGSALIPTDVVADLVPVLATAYRRTTLRLGSAGAHARATLDTDLGWSTLGEAPADLDRPDLAIIETKAGASPTALDRALWRRGHRPVRISKFGTGLAALDPGLPHLKWHRTLHRGLAISA